MSGLDSHEGAKARREQFCRDFVAHMVAMTPLDHFDDGEMVLDYAERTAPTYWDDEKGEGQWGMTALECVEADKSYWGDE